MFKLSSKNINKSDFLTHNIFKKIAELADKENTEAYVIGGFVRDKLLSKESNKDIDIVISGNGIEFARKLADTLKIKKVSIYKNFGTAMFQYSNTDFEFVGARKESYSKDSRNPIVSTGTIADDQNRRDFTINTLAISLNKDNYGELIDPFGGITDLNNKLIRTPLDPLLTFSDDPLRMLRAIRFASQLNFKIDEKSFKAIKENKERIKIITPERIHTELNKILMSPKPSIGFKLLYDSGLLKIIFPELHNLAGVDIKNNIGHKDNFYHTIKVVDNIATLSDDLWLRWAALLHDIAKPRTKKFIEGTGWTFYSHNFIGAKMVPDIFNRLRLPLNDKMKFVKKMVNLHMRPIALVEDTVSDSAIRRLVVDAGEDLDKLMTLCEADITSKNEKKVAKYIENFHNLRRKIIEVEERDSLKNFQPPISGEEIMEYFNIPASITVGNIKNEIKEAILEGIIPNDKEAAKKYMIEIGKRENLQGKKSS